MPIFKWNVPFISLIFLKNLWYFLFYFFPSISLHWSLRRLSHLSLLFFGTLHSDECTFPFLLCLALVFFSQLFVRPPQTTIFFCLHFFLGMIFITASHTMLQTFHSSSGVLSVRSKPLNLLVTSTVYSWGIWFISLLVIVVTYIDNCQINDMLKIKLYLLWF